MTEADKFEILEKIGHGSFGVIRKVRRKVDGLILCRKEINYIKMSTKEREQLHAEFSILNSLQHPNIVGYHFREHLKASQDLHLYMEYCGNGDLGRVIRNLKLKHQYAEEEFVWSIFAQLVTALYRCHYGVDPPEVGDNVMGVGHDAKPRSGKNVMILHRDLKPENIFLGEDNSVKLGDFGLSKIMQSHDFASTYVGTPFYMSPEICAAERYTLKSDIWSLGCIMFELCAKEPPFNAKTHCELVQKIRTGKFAQIPSVYSPELGSVIKSCLRVNPRERPDTAALLNLPVVKLMRKEREIVDLGQILKTKETQLKQKEVEIEDKVQQIHKESEKHRQELESTIRREWEVKARLEIDRQVQMLVSRQVKIELDRLSQRFDAEVQAKVASELQKTRRSREVEKENVAPRGDIATSSVTTSGDTDFPSVTDLTSLSIESPSSSSRQAMSFKKSARTPFGRSQTMGIGSPMDLEIIEPSPMSIASLSLSPRRHANNQGAGKDIFAAAARDNDAPQRWREPLTYSPGVSDEEDGEPILSPTRVKPSTKNPFKQQARPKLSHQKTAPLRKPNSQSNLFGTTTVTKPELLPASSGEEKKPPSPSRRLSKIPSSTHLMNPNTNTRVAETGSPIRRSKSLKAILNPSTASSTAQVTAEDDISRAVKQRNMMRGGRTLIELAQARACGRPVSSYGEGSWEDKENASRKRNTVATEPQKGGVSFAARMVGEGAPVWDPERDEMPSPFLTRAGRGRLGRI